MRSCTRSAGVLPSAAGWLAGTTLAWAGADSAWGLSAQLYALRRRGDGGFGDTLALEHLVRSAAERGADAVAISPMALATHDQPGAMEKMLGH